jgi:hypothetical protein
MPKVSNLTAEDRSKGGVAVHRRYGSDYLAARARRGMLAKELASVSHPERLTEDELDAIQRQCLVNQAAKMRAAKAAKRAARAAEQGAEVES